DIYLILFPEKVNDMIYMINNSLTQGIKISKNNSYFFTPAFYSSLDYSLLPKLKADAYISSYSPKGVNRIFLYILDAYISKISLQYYLKNIFTLLEEEEWEDDTTLSLQFYFVGPNHSVIIYLMKLLPSFLEKYYENTPLFFH